MIFILFITYLFNHGLVCFGSSVKKLLLEKFPEVPNICLPKAMKGSSMDSSEQKKTKKNLKKFLTRRPTLQAVREKGYIKGMCTRSGIYIMNVS